jgi:hypothetical protein
VGALEESPSDPGELDIAIVDGATLLVTAPDFTQTGYDPETGKLLKGSSQSAYYVIDNSVDTDLESIPATSTAYYVYWNLPQSGTYKVQLNGLQVGSYSMTVKAYDANGAPENYSVLPVIAKVGSISNFQVQFSAAPGSTTMVSRIASFESTLADINNSVLVGLIDNGGIANSLTSKIEGAQSAANAGQNQTAVNILNAFGNELNAQAGKHINGIAPQVLQEDVNSLISQLQ